jgi:GNAT superfamily N-acetyltransferase
MKSSVEIRPWGAGDADQLARLGSRLSARSLRSRFWAPTPTVPQSYLQRIGASWPCEWDAVVAIRDGQLIGWADYGRNEPGSSDADAAFCVIDAEQGRGIGTALVRALVERSAAAHIENLHADIAADNKPALRAWHRATDGLSAAMTLGIDGYRGTITVPATVAHAA